MHFTWREWLWLLALAGVLWLFRKARGSFWGLALMALPGTFAHELCHLMVGWLCFGHPVRFTVLPKRKKQVVELGSVDFRNLRWYNAFFIGVAPLLLLAVAWGIVHWRLQTSTAFTWANAVWLYLLANCLEAAVPSGHDLRMAARSPVGWVLLAGLLGAGWYWYQNGGSWKRPAPEALHLARASTNPSFTERDV
jgi:hypothetical protein